MKTKRMICMKAILKLALLTTFIFSVVSCSTESVTDLQDENLTAIAAKGKKARPISNSIVTKQPFGEQATFTGNMTHLGKISGTVGTGVINIDFATRIGIFTTAPDIDYIFAANGDELWTQSTLTLLFNETFTGATYTGGFEIIGGTGRFEGATGNLAINDGVYFIDDNGVDTYTHTAQGLITY